MAELLYDKSISKYQEQFMRKTVALLSGFILALVLVGCGSGSGSSSNNTTPAFKVTVSGS